MHSFSKCRYLVSIAFWEAAYVLLRCQEGDEFCLGKSPEPEQLNVTNLLQYSLATLALYFFISCLNFASLLDGSCKHLRLQYSDENVLNKVWIAVDILQPSTYTAAIQPYMN